MAYCRECGAEIGEVRFCPECGAAMADRAAVTAEPAPETEKKRSSCVAGLAALGLMALGVIIILFAIGGGGSSSRGNVPIAPQVPVSYEITYQVEEGSRASVTYRNAQDNTEQKDVMIFPNRPWQASYTMEYGDFAYISAQNGDDWGGVTCKILVDGVLWQQASSDGAYTIATCSGSVGRE